MNRAYDSHPAWEGDNGPTADEAIELLAAAAPAPDKAEPTRETPEQRQAQIVAWLRGLRWDQSTMPDAGDLADAIEHGEHLHTAPPPPASWPLDLETTPDGTPDIPGSQWPAEDEGCDV